jgi:hypothetical protein
MGRAILDPGPKNSPAEQNTGNTECGKNQEGDAISGVLFSISHNIL